MSPRASRPLGPPASWRRYGDERPAGYARSREWIERGVRLLYASDWSGRLYGRQCARPGFLRLERIGARLRSLGEGEPLRIAFLTDPHFGPTVPTWFLREAVERTMGLAPDLVLLGGDVLMLDERGAADAQAVLSLLRAPLGVYGVLGNHDIWVSRRLAERVHEQAGIELLANRGLVLATRLGPLYLAGADDAWSGASDAEAALAGCPEGVPSLLLAHSPASLLGMGEHPADLALCGHTHGGQVCLPSGRPLWTPHGKEIGISSGWGRVGRTWAYVSRGLGCTEVALRAWCPPEVTLLTLSR